MRDDNRQNSVAARRDGLVAHRRSEHRGHLARGDVAEVLLAVLRAPGDGAAQALDSPVGVDNAGLEPVPIVVSTQGCVEANHLLVVEELQVASLAVCRHLIGGLEAGEVVLGRIREVVLVHHDVRTGHGVQKGSTRRSLVGEGGDREVPDDARGVARVPDPRRGKSGGVHVAIARGRRHLQLVRRHFQHKLRGVRSIRRVVDPSNRRRPVRRGGEALVGRLDRAELRVCLRLLVEEGGHDLDVLGLRQVSRFRGGVESDGGWVGLHVRTAAGCTTHEYSVGGCILHLHEGRVGPRRGRHRAAILPRLLPARRDGVRADGDHAILHAECIDEAHGCCLLHGHLLQGNGETLASVSCGQRLDRGHLCVNGCGGAALG
mmetsp:Transcript_98927/g.308272  ORF Transcript_98927/g.308272 Transcript_98927/m.308272 type:complete len:375 (-) Transcript_98927:367-1491(-)